MKTQYYTASSLDGFVADPDNSLDWLFPLEDFEETGYLDFIKDVGALAMGSTTYEWLLDNHLFADADNPKPWPYDMPAWVFSSRDLRKVPGANIHFVPGDVRPVHVHYEVRR